MIDFSLHNSQYISGDRNPKMSAKFNELSENIRKCTGVVVKNKIAVGCLLYQIWESMCYVVEYKTVRDDYELESYTYCNCHQTVFYAVCDKFFGLDKKEVQTYMNVAECFVDKETFNLYDRYKDFKWYQLVEMIPLSEDQRREIDPSWSRQRIRDYKKSLKPPKEEPEAENYEQTSFIQTEEAPEEPEVDPEDLKDDAVYEAELRRSSVEDVIYEALKYRRQTIELHAEILKLQDDLEYFKKMAISKISE